MQLLSYESLIKWIVENENQDWLEETTSVPPQTVAMLLDLTNKTLDDIRNDCAAYLINNVSTTGFANFFREYHNKA